MRGHHRGRPQTRYLALDFAYTSPAARWPMHRLADCRDIGYRCARQVDAVLICRHDSWTCGGFRKAEFARDCKAMPVGSVSDAPAMPERTLILSVHLPLMKKRSQQDHKILGPPATISFPSLLPQRKETYIFISVSCHYQVLS